MSKYCKVCFDAGKDDNVVKSHFVRSGIGMNNPVICPTLLSIECKYCHQTGHTVKYCEVLKCNEKNKRRYEYDIKKSNVASDGSGNNNKKRKINMFETLIDSEDEDEDEELVEIKPKTELQGWAAIVAKKQPIISTSVPISRQEISSKTISSNVEEIKPRRIYDWGYVSDSDSD